MNVVIVTVTYELPSYLVRRMVFLVNVINVCWLSSVGQGRSLREVEGRQVYGGGRVR